MLKEKVKNILNLAKAQPALLAGRLLLLAALCGFLAGCWFYFMAEQRATPQLAARPLSRAAQAEGMRMSTEVLAAVLSKEAEKPENSDDTLSAALNRIYPELAENGYFILWRGTVGVCSPLTPDTAGLDFALQRDARGVYFARELEMLAAKGGGFYSFMLAHAAPLQGKNKTPSLEREFIAYVTPVYGTDLHLSLWRPADQTAFSLQAELEESNSKRSLLGLCMSGLSFLGLSVLLRNFRM